MRQYYRFKREHPDCVLLFRIGDFYEMFDDDAVVRELAEINGVPAKVLRSVEDVLAMREQKRRAEGQRQMLDNSVVASTSAKNMAQAAAAAVSVQPIFQPA